MYYMVNFAADCCKPDLVALFRNGI